jgi:U3 small nucleolar ribonucleoprotein protein IMP4
MTVVTTSRKPLPELRSLARDLAFSTGSQYLSRGKQAMEEILSLDETVVIVSIQARTLFLQVFHNGEPAVGVAMQKFTVERREDVIQRGLRISDRTTCDALRDYLDAHCIPEEGGPAILFDGAQRKRYRVDLVP